MNSETTLPKPEETSETASATSAPQLDIEDLLRQLHGQIKSSDWLQTNTADKLEQENPELIRAWKDAIGDEKTGEQK